jgi:menaquinone-dependent protoporphyrinogen oxidase
MPDTIVVYNSKYGSTRQYAEWIAEKSGADLLSMKDAKGGALSLYKNVVFGTRIHGPSIGAEFMRTNWAHIKNSKIIMFMVGGSPADSPAYREAFESSFPAAVREKIRMFALRGRIGKLDVLDSLILAAMKFGLGVACLFNKDPKMKEMSENMGKPADHVKIENIEPILAELKKGK